MWDVSFPPLRVRWLRQPAVRVLSVDSRDCGLDCCSPGKLVLPCVSRAAIITAWADCSAVITGLNVHSEVFCCWWIPRRNFRAKHSRLRGTRFDLSLCIQCGITSKMPVVRGLALNRCFWEIYSKVVVPLHSWCFLHAEDEFFLPSSFWDPSCPGVTEERKMGIIRVTLIHLLPFIDHGRVERGFITARSFSAQTHLVKEWADVWAAWWSAGSCPCCVFVS